MYYFIILNSQNISRLSSIHLAVVAYASDVKRYGHNKVLDQLLSDMKRLEQGVVLGPEFSPIYGTVVSLPADNLAANEKTDLWEVFPLITTVVSARCERLRRNRLQPQTLLFSVM